MIDSTENLIKILGIEKLPDEQKAQIIDGASELVQQRLLIRLQQNLDDPTQEKLQQVMAKNNPDELAEFVATVAPEFEQWVVEETLKVKAELAEINQLD